jgi:hypothetical protein
MVSGLQQADWPPQPAAVAKAAAIGWVTRRAVIQNKRICWTKRFIQFISLMIIIPDNPRYSPACQVATAKASSGWHNWTGSPRASGAYTALFQRTGLWPAPERGRDTSFLVRNALKIKIFCPAPENRAGIFLPPMAPWRAKGVGATTAIGGACPRIDKRLVSPPPHPTCQTTFFKHFFSI